MFTKKQKRAQRGRMINRSGRMGSNKVFTPVHGRVGNTRAEIGAIVAATLAALGGSMFKRKAAGRSS